MIREFKWASDGKTRRSQMRMTTMMTNQSNPDPRNQERESSDLFKMIPVSHQWTLDR